LQPHVNAVTPVGTAAASPGQRLPNMQWARRSRRGPGLRGWGRTGLKPPGPTPEGAHPTRVTGKAGHPPCTVQTGQYSHAVGKLTRGAGVGISSRC
jgi:hypothetical protein